MINFLFYIAWMSGFSDMEGTVTLSLITLLKSVSNTTDKPQKQKVRGLQENIGSDRRGSEGSA
jgi:hypothetical protein